ncbi:MAG: dihydropteroate synthase [Flavobacteriales bacterium]|nr:dihydropteroate synthase [Flavobacteriales bacterium]
MGIVNCTPDSFYAGSRSESEQESLKMVEKMVEEGVDIIDLGAYSSRPGAPEVSETEELNRLLPSLEAIRHRFPQVLISVDTFRSKVAEEALERGVHLINDISASKLDEKMLDVISKYQANYIMMHMRGTPQNMQSQVDYDNLVGEIQDYFSKQISSCQKKGIENLILDPGFGFSKTLEQNYELMNQLEQLHSLNHPILVGISRKSMIYKLLKKEASEVLNATSALHLLALSKGAHILRVHDVAEAKEIIKISAALATH